MSETPEPKNNTQTSVNSWIIRIGSFVMSIAIMVSSWFLNQAWDRINNNEKSIQDLRMNNIEMSSNRFTAKDWAVVKNTLDTERLAIDRRIIRLEESLPIIKETLIDIKNDLNKGR